VANFRTLDLNLLRVFDAVMSEGSLTRAAQRLSMTQPAVSNAMRRLRDAVGDDLLTRTPHGVRPTLRGQALWPEVQEALARLRLAIAPDEEDVTARSRVFRLAMADATAAILLPPLVALLQGDGALPHIELSPLVTRDPRGLLEAGEVDFAVGHFPQTVAAISVAGDAATLRRRRLSESEYVCVMRRGHPLARGELSLDAFCSARHVMASLSGRAHGAVDEALANLHRRRDIVLTVNQYYTAARVVAASDLLAVLPAGFVSLTGVADQLVTRFLPVAPGRVFVDALWHRRHDASAAHRWLLERMEHAAGAVGRSAAKRRARRDAAPVR
jgi:DNA-binding transcriptional LysR family regulator